MAGGEASDAGSRTSTGGGRSWLGGRSGLAVVAPLDGWRDEVETGHRAARRGADVDLRVRRSRDLVRGISVVVVSRRGGDRIDRCLRSLAEQTLDPALFEVIVVRYGVPAEPRDTVEKLRSAHPSLTLKIIHLEGASSARDAGVAAARREYTTFIDERDHVSLPYLAALLARAAPRVVPIATVVDVGPGGEHLNETFAEHIGTLSAPEDIAGATAFGGAKVVATDLLKDLAFDAGVAAAEDVVFWTSVALRGDVAFCTCPPSEGATYFRPARQEPAQPFDLRAFDSCVTQRLDLVARLEGLAAGDLQALEIVRGPIAAQASAIGDYLKANPSEHGHVVAELDRRPIFHVPYDRINRGMPRGLAVAYAFPPYMDTSAVVTAKRIRAKADVVDVISNAMDRIRFTDNTLRRISGPFVRRVTALPTPSYFSNWASMESFSIEGMKTIREWEAGEAPYGWLYSRAQFAASHFLAAVYKLANPAATWHAEFSDPLSRDIIHRERGTPVREGSLLQALRSGLRTLGLPVPTSPNCFVWCEEVAYALADELIFTNSNQMDYMLGYCSNPALAALARAKALVAPHPTLPPQFYTMLDCGRTFDDRFVHLAYFGNLYATRDLDDVLTAVAHLEAPLRDSLRVHVYTTKPDDLQRRAGELAVTESVRIASYVGYLEFLSLTTKFDCLIVTDADTRTTHGCNPYLPSKLADYMGSGTPVWGLVETGSTMSTQVLDYVSPIGDLDAAANVLATVVRQKLEASSV